MTERSVV